MAGILFEQDELILSSSVNLVLNRRKKLSKPELNFVECGCASAQTSSTLINLVNLSKYRQEFSFTYYGIDSNDFTNKSPTLTQTEFKFVKGYTFNKEVIAQIPKEIDWLFIDACHCAMCVQRDAKIYIPLLSKIGVAAFHDASPLFQSQHPQNYGKLNLHHNPNEARKGVQVLLGLSRVDFAKMNMNLWKKALAQKSGGVQVYNKTSKIKVI